MTRRPTTLLERAIEAARDAEPPELAAEQSKRMIAAAMAEKRRARHTRDWRWLAAAAVVLLSAAGGFWASRLTQPSHAGGALRATLATGDRIVATAATDFRVDEGHAAQRRVSVRRGHVLFDVAALGPGAAFEVNTPHTKIRVVGTVFSVGVEGGLTEVRVYEGRVTVRRAGRERTLSRGASWSSTGARVHEPDPLENAGNRAAATRDRARPHKPSAKDGGVERGRTSSGAANTIPPVLEAEREQAPSRPASTDADTTDSSIGPVPAEIVTQSGASSSTADAGVPDRASRVATVRAHIVAGRFTVALTLIEREQNGEPAEGVWWWLEGDAMRGMHRDAEAIAAYRAAIPNLPRASAAQAAYAAARLELQSRRAPERAIEALDFGAADAADSPLRERALALRVRALRALSRTAEARATAEKYLASFPEGDTAEAMREFLRAD